MLKNIIKESLSQKPNERYLARYSSNPARLLRLSRDGDAVTRKYVALNPNTTSDILKELSLDEDVLVLYFCAQHPNISLDDLKSLSNHLLPAVSNRAFIALKFRK